MREAETLHTLAKDGLEKQAGWDDGCDRQARASFQPPRHDRFKLKVGLAWIGFFILLASLFASFRLDYGLIVDKLPFLLGFRLTPNGFLQGAALTIFVTSVSLIFACIMGALTALGRMSRNPLAFAAATFYGSFIRGTPLLVQVLLIYLALPQLGLILDALTSGIIALSLNYGAYLAETIRSGILSVPQGQREAARALGLANWLIAWKIITPQALRVIIPPAGTHFVSMLKDSSLISLMGLWELNFLAQSYGRSNYRYLEMLTAAAAIYWMLSISFELIQARLERHYGRAAAKSAGS